jgi:hypothetical protein
MRTAASCVSRSACRDDMQSWWHTVRPHCVAFSRLPTKAARCVAQVSARQSEWSFDCNRAFHFFRRWVQLRADGFLLVVPPGSGAAALALGGRPACVTEPPQLLLPVATGRPHQSVIDCLLPSGSNQLVIGAQLPSDQAEACPAGMIELRAPAAAKPEPAYESARDRAERRHGGETRFADGA